MSVVREVELVERFAAGIEAEIEWIEGSEEELFAALEVHELDLVVGGITSVSPWASVAALTHPYLTTASLVAVPDGREPPDDIAGLEVGVESSSGSRACCARPTRASSRSKTPPLMKGPWRSTTISSTTSTSSTPGFDSGKRTTSSQCRWARRLDDDHRAVPARTPGRHRGASSRVRRTMRTSTAFEQPPDKARVNRRAIRLEWITIAYLVTAIFFIYVTLGASQAMKAAWIEDILSLVPPISFLVAARVRRRSPSERFPFGYHRAVSVGYLCASLALFVMGLFILYDSVMKLISFEHAPIGLVQPWGEPIWLGGFMIPALDYSAIPAVIIGRLNCPWRASFTTRCCTRTRR